MDMTWRKMVATSRTDEYRRLLKVKKMVSGLVIHVVDSIESVSGVNNIMDAVIGTSYVEGVVMSVWRQMECNADIKISISSFWKLKVEQREGRGRKWPEVDG